MPSPFLKYANFYDGIFPFVDKFVKGDDYNYSLNDTLSSIYFDRIRDGLRTFESKIVE